MEKFNVQKLVAILIVGLLMIGGWESCKKDEAEKTEDVTGNDSMSKTFNFVYSETEDFVRNLPDEAHSKPLVLSETDSLNFDKIAQDFLVEQLGTSLSKNGDFQEHAEDAISSGCHVLNLCQDRYIIEYTHWDAGKWGAANWGNFETFVKVFPYNGSIVALVILYKQNGFQQGGKACLKICTATYGSVYRECIKEFEAQKQCERIPGQYIYFPVVLEKNNEPIPLMRQVDGADGVNLLNLCPVVISNNGYRSYDNSVYIQTKSKNLNNSYIAINGVGFISKVSNQDQGCEYVCAKYINVVAQLEKAVWASAKYWPEILKVAEEGFEVYPNDGTLHQVREGDILCFAPTSPNKEYHVGVVAKIAPGQKATIVHTDNNNVFDWNTEVVINDKRETELGTITHIIRKSSPYDTEVGAKYSEVHSVKPIVIENLQHFEQLKGQCNASAYVIAASTFKRVLGDHSYIANTDKANEVYNYVWGYDKDKNPKIVGKSLYNACYYYCNKFDNDFLYGEFCSKTNPGHSEVNQEKFIECILENLDKNRIVIADMRGTFTINKGVKEWEKDCYYSDDPSINPDLGSIPTYFTKSGDGHVIGIVYIKVDPNNRGEGIVGYYDTMAAPESRKGVGKNNIRYVSLSNFLISNYNAVSDGEKKYDAYSVGLKDGLKPIVFEINLSKTDNIFVNDKLELIILSDIVSDFKVMVDGKEINEVNYSTLSKSKKTIMLPTKEAKTYHGTVKTTYDGDNYEESFSYVVINKKEDNPVLPAPQITSVKLNSSSVTKECTKYFDYGDDVQIEVKTDIVCDEISVDFPGYDAKYGYNKNTYSPSFEATKSGTVTIVATKNGKTAQFEFKIEVEENPVVVVAPEITSADITSSIIRVGDGVYIDFETSEKCDVDVYIDGILKEEFNRTSGDRYKLPTDEAKQYTVKLVAKSLQDPSKTNSVTKRYTVEERKYTIVDAGGLPNNGAQTAARNYWLCNDLVFQSAEKANFEGSFWVYSNGQDEYNTLYVSKKSGTFSSKEIRLIVSTSITDLRDSNIIDQKKFQGGEKEYSIDIKPTSKQLYLIVYVGGGDCGSMAIDGYYCGPFYYESAE
ncbi:MAG: hypothetical protein II852_14135 [Bacteroidales bacterium]|nr:hypothetical protein [Bacteroidales bacterium]